MCIAVQEREDVGRVIIFSSPLHEAAKEGEKTLMSRKNEKKGKKNTFPAKEGGFPGKKNIDEQKKR